MLYSKEIFEETKSTRASLKTRPAFV